MKTFKFSLALFLTVLAGNALATQAAGTGVISFSGAIVEQSCTIEQAQDRTSLSCYRNGKTAVLPVSQQGTQTLLTGVARTQIDWLDKERRQGVLTVTYE